MIAWLKNLFVKQYTGADWLANRAEVARAHLAKEAKRKILEELGPKWIGHPSRHIQRKEQ